MLRQLLEECRCEVMTAPSGFAALDLLTTWRPDVIVSDIGMPDMDGFSFIEQLRQRPASQGGRIPAVALTAHARAADRARARYAGFNHHVPNPVEPLELFAVLAPSAGATRPDGPSAGWPGSPVRTVEEHERNRPGRPICR